MTLNIKTDEALSDSRKYRTTKKEAKQKRFCKKKRRTRWGRRSRNRKKELEEMSIANKSRSS